MIAQAALGAIIAAAVAYAAYRARALAPSGALAAIVVGAVVYAAGSWQAALVLFAFFIPSSLLSRIGRRRKATLDTVGKGGPRDAWQVLANGGVAALAIALAPFYSIAAAAFAGALAAASADTWGTEVGTLARGRPRSLFTLRRIDTGLSGGITWQGTAATLLGALAVAAAAQALHVAPFAPVAFAGFVGAFVDSALGASAQALRYCPHCARACETDPHACGTPTQLRRGVRFLGNDAVNFAATASGAVLALLAVRFL